jgi:hypothetical protein
MFAQCELATPSAAAIQIIGACAAAATKKLRGEKFVV